MTAVNDKKELVDQIQTLVSLEKELFELYHPRVDTEPDPQTRLMNRMIETATGRKRKRKIQLEARIAMLKQAIDRLNDAAASPIVWHGEKWEFAAMIVDCYKKDWVKADSETAALTQAAAHFVDGNHKPFNVRSILQSYKSKSNARAISGRTGRS